MQKAPKGYSYLDNVTNIPVLTEAMKLIGTKEIEGKEDNPVILGWAKEVGMTSIYSNDETPWCGLFMAVCAKRAGYIPPKGAAWAKSWANFGTPVPVPMLGDIITFNRPGGGGHVGIYVGEDPSAFHILGGNQDNQVKISRVSKDRKYSITRPPFVSLPDTVKQIKLTINKATGALSVNEA